MDPLVVQVALAGPLMLALMIVTLRRRDDIAVRRHLFWLLTLILAWMIGMAAEHGLNAAAASSTGQWGDAAQTIVELLILIPSAFMSPVFLLLMARYARFELFEDHLSASCAVLAPFAVFFILFATNDLHGWMLPAGSSVLHADAQVGLPVFWVFQGWSNVTALAGLGLCLHIAARTSVSAERWRMLLLCAGAAVPMLAHGAYVLRLLPLDYPLTPSALGVTGLLLVTAVQRYHFLEVQPVARRDVIEASLDGVVIADISGRIVDLNPAAAALSGGVPRDWVERELGDFIARLGILGPLDDPREILSALRKEPRSRRERGTACLEVETARGLSLELSLGRPQDARGSVAGEFIVLRDRSSERSAERRLYQSQKLESVGILAAGVAHEVNNPLAFVRANMVQLRDVADEADALRAAAGKSQDEFDMAALLDESLGGIDRIHDIVQGLLRFSRVPTSRDERSDVNEALREAVRFASLDGRGSLRFEAEYASVLPEVVAPHDQLIQVFLNLLLNAKHAVEDQPEALVFVSTDFSRGSVEVRVQDNGPGVPDELRDRIFDPFFTTRAPNEGTGLGLSIAFDIVRELGGHLELLAASAAGGASFVVRLPASKASAEASPARA